MSHWYERKTGEPAYTYINSKGEEKDTTLRQARQLDLWPSVTTVMGMAASPGLDMYRQQQLCQAAWDQRPLPDMTYNIWKCRVVDQSKEHAKNASNRGTEIHDALENFYTNGTFSGDLAHITLPVVDFLEKEFPDAQWVAEASFCSSLGFGGKVDLHDPVNKIVLDFKTKDTDDIKKMVAYDGHHLQTAAYAVGLFEDSNEFYNLGYIKRYNLFISTQIPGLLKLTESTDFDREWDMFKSLLDYWHLSNRYYPNA